MGDSLADSSANTENDITILSKTIQEYSDEWRSQTPMLLFIFSSFIKKKKPNFGYECKSYLSSLVHEFLKAKGLKPVLARIDGYTMTASSNSSIPKLTIRKEKKLLMAIGEMEKKLKGIKYNDDRINERMNEDSYVPYSKNYVMDGIKNFVKVIWDILDITFLFFSTTKMIFCSVLPPSECCEETPFVQFSQSLLAFAAKRFDAVKMLKRICLVFSSPHSVERHQTELMKIWSLRDGTGTREFLDLVQNCEQPLVEVEGKIVARMLVGLMTLHKEQGRYEMTKNHFRSRKLSPEELWWTTVVCRAFVLYMDGDYAESRNMSTGEKLKDMVERQMNQITVAPEDSENSESLEKKSSNSSVHQIVDSISRVRTIGGSRIHPGEDDTGGTHSRVGTRTSRRIHFHEDASGTTDEIESRRVKKRQRRVLSTKKKRTENLAEIWRLCTWKEIEDFVLSDLIIHVRRMTYRLHLSMAEVYLATNLAAYLHQRRFGKLVANKDTCAEFSIGSKLPEYIDEDGDILHVARMDSDTFEECKNVPQGSPVLGANKRCGKAELNINFTLIVNTLRKFGKLACGRAPTAFRLDIGCGTMSFNGKELNLLVGCQQISGLSEVEKEEFMTEIGRICDFVWECIQTMQKKAGMPPLGGDSSRRKFSQQLRDALHISDSTMEGEFITISIMEIFPNVPTCEKHKDKCNPQISVSAADGLNNGEYRYCKTGAFNATICLEDFDPKNQQKQTIYLLQVLVNFRQSVTRKSLKLSNPIQKLCYEVGLITLEADSRLKKLFRHHRHTPNFSDLRNLFVDESLPLMSDNSCDRQYRYLGIHPCSSCYLEHSVILEILNSKKYKNLATDQFINMCFLATRTRGDRWDAWIKLIDNRRTDIGMGVNPLDGRERMTRKVVEILYTYVLWINQLGKEGCERPPLGYLQEVMVDVCRGISNELGERFDFEDLFYFTKLVIGSCVVAPGSHLRNIFFPLCRPKQLQLCKLEAAICTSEIDTALDCIANTIGMKTPFRDLPSHIFDYCFSNKDDNACNELKIYKDFGLFEVGGPRTIGDVPGVAADFVWKKPGDNSTWTPLQFGVMENTFELLAHKKSSLENCELQAMGWIKLLKSKNNSTQIRWQDEIDFLDEF